MGRGLDDVIAQPTAGIESVAFSLSQHGEFELHAAQREFQVGGICCLRCAIVGCIGIDGGRADLCGVMPVPWWRRVDRPQDDSSRQVMAQCFQQQELAVFVDFQLLGDARAHAAFGQQVGEEGRRFDGGRFVARVQQQAACLGIIVRMGPCQ